VTTAPSLTPPRLEDGTVLVRQLEERDAAAWSRAALDTDIAWRAYHGRIHFTEDESAAYIRRLRERGLKGEAIGLAITDPGDTEFLGSTLLFNFDWNEGVAEIGFWAAPWARGRGVCTRAVLLTSNWAFDALGIGRIQGLTHTDNPGAHRVLERAGYQREGTLRGLERDGDVRIDQVSFARLATDPQPA
jgi:RimJ/RimL family protein N-acetyltransferase